LSWKSADYDDVRQRAFDEMYRIIVGPVPSEAEKAATIDRKSTAPVKVASFEC
jgi:hypothetical protein